MSDDPKFCGSHHVEVDKPIIIGKTSVWSCFVWSCHNCNHLWFEHEDFKEVNCPQCTNLVRKNDPLFEGIVVATVREWEIDL